MELISAFGTEKEAGLKLSLPNAKCHHGEYLYSPFAISLVLRSHFLASLLFRQELKPCDGFNALIVFLVISLRPVHVYCVTSPSLLHVGCTDYLHHASWLCASSVARFRSPQG